MESRPVSVPVTVPVGCPIYRPKTSAGRRGDVTFHKDVLPILQRNCQECHRPGGVAPFALLSFRQAINWAADLKDLTQSRKMPPWKISEGLAFLNERRLTVQEIATLAAWVDGEMPEGDARDAPPPVKFGESWRLGTPDLVLTMGSTYQVGPSGNDVFRCFVLPTNVAEDKFVQAIEVKPGNPRIVHHALLFIDTAGKGRALERLQQQVVFRDPHGGNELDKGPGYYGGMGIGFVPAGNLGGWAPGQMPRTLPDGTGIKMPAGADIVIQMHYHRDGRLENDRTSVGLYLAKTEVSRPYQGEVLTGAFEAIPAGSERFAVQGRSFATEDMTIFDLMPHMHQVGKEIKVTLTPPGGKAMLLLHIKNWDFNWQETYVLKEPLPVKAGTRFDLEAVYDNSASNPNNPFKPPRTVVYGEQTFNEMCNVYLGGTSKRKGMWLPLERSLAKKSSN